MFLSLPQQSGAAAYFMWRNKMTREPLQAGGLRAHSEQGWVEKGRQVGRLSLGQVTQRILGRGGDSSGVPARQEG